MLKKTKEYLKTLEKKGYSDLKIKKAKRILEVYERRPKLVRRLEGIFINEDDLEKICNPYYEDMKTENITPEELKEFRKFLQYEKEVYERAKNMAILSECDATHYMKKRGYI